MTIPEILLESQTVGVYTPSKNWNKFQHIAVMSNKMNGVQEDMIASVGYADADDIEHTRELVIQALIYSKAPRVFQMLKEGRFEDAKFVAQIEEHEINTHTAFLTNAT